MIRGKNNASISEMAIYKRYRGKRVDRHHPNYRKAAWIAEGTIDGVYYKESLKKKGVKTREEAEAEEDLIIGRIRMGEYDLLRNRTTYLKFVDEIYLPVAQVKNEAYKTKIFETDKLKEYFGNTLIRNITVAKCEGYKSWRLWQKKYCQKCVHNIVHDCPAELISPSTVNREITTHSAILSLAVKERQIKENPMQWVRMLDEPPPRDRLLTIEEKTALFIQLQTNIQLLAIVILTLVSGWRKAQILGIEKEHLDFNYQAVWLKKSKRAKARKTPTNKIAWQVLSFLAQKVESGHLFRNSRTGEPLKDFRRSWYILLDRAGIKNFQFRDLRHVFATNMLESGADLAAIQKAMAHSRTKTTEIYAHVTDENLQRSLQGVENDSIINQSLERSFSSAKLNHLIESQDVG